MRHAWNSLPEATAAVQAIVDEAGGILVIVPDDRRMRSGYIPNVLKAAGVKMITWEEFRTLSHEAYLERQARREERAARMNGDAVHSVPHTGKTEKTQDAHKRWESHRRERAQKQSSSAKTHHSPGEQLGRGKGRRVA